MSVIHKKTNELDQEKNKTEEGDKNIIETTQVNKPEGEQNTLTTPSLLVYEEDDVDSVKINGNARKIDVQDNELDPVSNMTLFNKETDLNKKFKVKIRPKGDRKIHFLNLDSMSYKLDIRGENKFIYGMEEMSIQKPNNSGYVLIITACLLTQTYEEGVYNY